ncbi:MAG TPA: YciI family protein [Acidimicrobiales bacterium]|nr:YciI family protein [Acidimicrobiales bacterium]
MALYLLAVYPNADPAISEREFRQTVEDVGALVDELAASGGTFVFGGGLNQLLPSTVIRSVDGAVVTTDGPFAESKEQLGGFWIIDVDDFETARGWGTKFAAATRHTVEVATFERDDSTVDELLGHAIEGGMVTRD